MAWQQCTAWRPAQESKKGLWLPELSGPGRSWGEKRRAEDCSDYPLQC